MNPCTPHPTVNPDLHARWLSWLDPDAVKSAAGGRLLDERHIDVKTKQARVLVERYFDPVKQRVRVRKRYMGDYSPMQAREFDRISTLMVKNFFPSSVTLGSQSPTLQLGGQRSESDRDSEARETEIDMAHFGSDLLAWEGLSRNARLSPFSQVSSLAALYAALLRKMHQFHRCGLIHCDIKADNICVPSTSASAGAGGLAAALSGNFELGSITPIDFGMTLLRGKQDAFDCQHIANAAYLPPYYAQCMQDCWRLMNASDNNAELHSANDRVSCLSWRVDVYSLAHLMDALTNMAVRYHGANQQEADSVRAIVKRLKEFGSIEPGLTPGVDQRKWATQLMAEIKPGATNLPYMVLAADLEKLAGNFGAAPNAQIAYDLRDVAVRVQTANRPLDASASELPPSESLYVLAGQSSHAPSAEVIDERLWKLAQALAPKQGTKAYSDYLDKAPHPAKYEARAIDQIAGLIRRQEENLSGKAAEQRHAANDAMEAKKAGALVAAAQATSDELAQRAAELRERGIAEAAAIRAMMDASKSLLGAKKSDEPEDVSLPRKIVLEVRKKRTTTDTPDIILQKRTITLTRKTVSLENFSDFDGGPEMVHIPSGQFWMGNELNLEPSSLEYERTSRQTRYHTANPRHHVLMKAFALGKYPVTKAQWLQFSESVGRQINRGMAVHQEYPRVIGTTREKVVATASWNNPGFTQSNSHPVVGISWSDAQEYCDWLSKKTKKSYRLPTEAEWEYACRANTHTFFSAGDRIEPHQANFESRWTFNGSARGWYQKSTTSVTFHKANPFGLNDMHGNVWEWCEDCYHDSYDNAPTDGSAREGFINGSRVLRGGSWETPPSELRSAYRGYSDCHLRSDICGFRIALTIP